jgi:hypothetical protein
MLAGSNGASIHQGLGSGRFVSHAEIALSLPQWLSDITG